MTVVALALGCRGPEDPLPVPEWPDVAPIVEASCTPCHFHDGPAPFPLTTWDEVQAFREPLWNAVQSGAMPPFPAEPGPYAYRDDPTLTEAELDLLGRWVEADGPGPAGSVLEPVPIGELPRTDAVLTMPEPYTPEPGITDVYRCFTLAGAEQAQSTWLVGYRVVPGNTSLDHHARLQVIAVDDGGAALASLTDADPDPGFACDRDEELDYGGRLTRLGGWLPGKGPIVYPAGTGTELGPESVYVLVMHYDRTAWDGGPDDTRVELMLADAVDRPGARVRLSGLQDGFLVPAGASDVRWSTTVPVSSLEADGVVGTDGLVLYSVNGHLHEHGATAEVILDRDGDESALLRIPRWNVDWQLEYWFEQPLVVGPDDRLTLTCTYDNSAGTTDLVWGGAEGAEMCLSFLFATEP